MSFQHQTTNGFGPKGTASIRWTLPKILSALWRKGSDSDLTDSHHSRDRLASFRMLPAGGLLAPIALQGAGPSVTLDSRRTPPSPPSAMQCHLPTPMLLQQCLVLVDVLAPPPTPVLLRSVPDTWLAPVPNLSLRLVHSDVPPPCPTSVVANLVGGIPIANVPVPRHFLLVVLDSLRRLPDTFNK